MNKQIQSLESTVSNISNIPEIIKLKESGLYQVKSFSDPAVFYVVDMFEATCTCPHFKFRGVECKHLQAVKVKLSWDPFERAGVVL